MRILIIGHPGSGKTYLADSLHTVTGIAKLDIDVLFDKYPYCIVSKKLYRKMFGKLLGNTRDIIIDGYHGHLMPNELWKSADVVIYLNLPSEELQSNIRSRYELKKANREFSHGQSLFINVIKNFMLIKFWDKKLKREVEKSKNLLSKNCAFYELKSREEINTLLNTFCSNDLTRPR